MYKRILLAYDGSVEGRTALREGALTKRAQKHRSSGKSPAEDMRPSAMGLLHVRGQPIKRAIFFAKIIKIRPHVHRRTGCALDEIVRHELAAVPVKIVA